MQAVRVIHAADLGEPPKASKVTRHCGVCLVALNKYNREPFCNKCLRAYGGRNGCADVKRAIELRIELAARQSFACVARKNAERKRKEKQTARTTKESGQLRLW